MASRFLQSLVLASALAAPIALVAPIQPAQATTLAPLSVEQLTDASDYVVRGEITETWTEVDEKGRIWTRARLTVNETFKGADSPSELIVDSMGGEFAGQSLHVEARAEFSAFEDAVVFLHQRDDGRLVPVGKFLGKYTVRRAPDNGRYYARTWHPKGGLAFDARFIPHPEESERLYLDDLVGRIEARVRVGWDGQPIPGLTVEKLTEINAVERRIR